MFLKLYGQCSKFKSKRYFTLFVSLKSQGILLYRCYVGCDKASKAFNVDRTDVHSFIHWSHDDDDDDEDDWQLLLKKKRDASGLRRVKSFANKIK